MAYFVRVGSTDPPGPVTTFDRVDDEALAVEMVRVIESFRPTAWSIILPLAARPGLSMRSHPALVEQAQQEYDDRDDDVRAQAEEVRAEALRRLGRLDDAPAAVDLEPRREGRRRGRGFLARRRSQQQQQQQQQDGPAETRVEIEMLQLVEETRSTAAAVARVEPVEPDDREEVEAPPAVEREPVEADDRQEVDAPPAVEREPVEAWPAMDRRDTRVDTQDSEPPAVMTTSEGPTSEPTEPTPDLERHRRRGRRARTFVARRRSERRDDRPVVEPEEKAASQDLQPSEGRSEINERIGEYTLSLERRSGRDRRSGIDRRRGQVEGFDGSSDRRARGERRSGRSRRRETTSV